MCTALILVVTLIDCCSVSDSSMRDNAYDVEAIAEKLPEPFRVRKPDDWLWIVDVLYCCCSYCLDVLCIVINFVSYTLHATLLLSSCSVPLTR